MDKQPLFLLENYKETPYSLPKIALSFSLHPTRTHVVSSIEVVLRENHPVGTPLIFDGDGLKLISIKINGKVLKEDAYKATPQRLEILQPQERHFTLEIETEIDPDSNRQLMGLYRSNGVFCTQCEAEGFRRITYFYDRPDVLSVYTVRIEAPKEAYPVLLSNGNCIEKGQAKDGNHYAIWHDPYPKPCYLFALVGGHLSVITDSFTTMSGRHVALAIYTELHKEKRALYAMDALKRSMRWDEKRFGREYDLDVFNIVAVSDFNMGAMENKGLNIFNDKFVLADPETATDADYAGIERVIAHEYFHNWTGNRITCRDWFQLCLKEGLTVYRDQEFSSDERSRPVQRISNVRLLKAAQFVEDAGPLAHPVRPRSYKEINNFYTATVYEKGAELVRMIHIILGEDLFRKGLNLYFDRHDGQACTIEDFIACFAEVSGKDFSQFMLWYEQAGTPQVKASWKQEGTNVVIELQQVIPDTPGQKNKKPMVIPIRFGLVSEKGEDVPYQESHETSPGLLLLTQEKQTFTFSGVKEKVIPSLLRGFSSPVLLQTNLDHKALAFLACHDKDAVNQWTSLNKLLFDNLLLSSKDPQANIEEPTKKYILPVLEQIISSERLEPAFQALCLSLPSEGEIAGQLDENINPDFIHKARFHLFKTITQHLEEKFSMLFEKFKTQGAYQPDADQGGKRALANSALTYLSVARKDPSLAQKHYAKANNMTDKIASLAILTSYFPERSVTQEVLKNFEEQYHHFPLVMDKWFALQACICDDHALERVKTLTKHPLFSFENPNRTRALLGSFAGGNLVGFHRADGAGYRYFCEKVHMIDKQNAQLSSRLLTVLRSWKKLEPQRRNEAHKALEKIAQAGNLSTDLSDILGRMLD